MQNLKKDDLIDFEKGDYELVRMQDASFKAKGGDGAMLLRKKGTSEYFAITNASENYECKDFLSFCQTTCANFYKFKFGDDFFSDAKEFHEDLDADRYLNGLPLESYDDDYKTYKAMCEEDFSNDFEGALYPAIIMRQGSELEAQHENFLQGKLAGKDCEFSLRALKENEVAVFQIGKDNALSLLHHYTGDMSYNILRGEGTIGNLIEVSYGPINVLLDCGKELNDESEEESEVEKQVLQKPYDAILISHYHLDHAGLVNKASAPVFMGKGCFDVLASQIAYTHGEPLKGVSCFKPNEEFEIKKGDFALKIKPILVDHSAYDSYMFLLSGGEKSLLYTGDFRANGRKSFSATLKNLPDKIDYLICEATNMFSQRKNISEKDLEQKAAELMSKYKRVFVLQAGTNIDRLVSFYKASRKNGKVFLMDSYVAGITENLPNIPNVKTFSDVYAFWIIPSRGRNFVRKCESDWAMRKYRKILGYCEIGSPKNGRNIDLSNFTMLVRSSMLNFLKRVDDDKKARFKTSIFENSVLIYSLWSGYKEKEDIKTFLSEMQSLGVDIVDLHTSGHADKFTIDLLKSKVSPSVIEYVHYIDRTNE